MANIRDIPRDALMPRRPYGREKLIDGIKGAGIGCEYGEYDR